MIRSGFYILILLCSWSLSGQEGFVPENGKTRDRINFRLVNNLILMPVEVNGVELTFLLDSGASNTIIFSFEERDSILLNDAKTFYLRGLSAEAPVPAIRSENNRIRIGKAVKQQQTIYVVFDGTLRLSARLGVPVHGIIGWDFLKDFVVEVNYVAETLRFFTPESYPEKRARKYEMHPLSFFKNKPYLQAGLSADGDRKPLTLLIDSGSSDALWLFENDSLELAAPPYAFEDYLGISINGNIYGQRARVPVFLLGNHSLQQVNVAYPDLTVFASHSFYKERNGSLGGDLLKRFHLILDYPGHRLFLRKNSKFKQPFYYNMSGLTLEHGSYTVAKTRENTPAQSSYAKVSGTSSSVAVYAYETYSFSLERLFVVADVRKDSPADKAGLVVGDEITEIDNRPVYNYKLHEMNEIFFARKPKTVRLKIVRNGVSRKVVMQLTAAWNAGEPSGS